MRRHVEAISAGNLSHLFDTECARDCPQGRRCIAKVGTVTELQNCAAESFGVAALEGDWDNVTACQAATKQWFQLAYGGRITNGSGAVLSVRYSVGGQPVCAPAWAAMRGIQASTGEAIDRAVRRGEHGWGSSTRHERDAGQRQLRGNLNMGSLT